MPPDREVPTDSRRRTASRSRRHRPAQRARELGFDLDRQAPRPSKHIGGRRRSLADRGPARSYGPIANDVVFERGPVTHCRRECRLRSAQGHRRTRRDTEFTKCPQGRHQEPAAHDDSATEPVRHRTTAGPEDALDVTARPRGNRIRSSVRRAAASITPMVPRPYPGPVRPAKTGYPSRSATRQQIGVREPPSGPGRPAPQHLTQHRELSRYVLDEIGQSYAALEGDPWLGTVLSIPRIGTRSRSSARIAGRRRAFVRPVQAIRGTQYRLLGRGLMQSRLMSRSSQNLHSGAACDH